MICEILHPIFDALNDEFGFHGLWVAAGIENQLGEQDSR